MVTDSYIEIVIFLPPCKNINILINAYSINHVLFRRDNSVLMCISVHFIRQWTTSIIIHELMTKGLNTEVYASAAILLFV